jgi:L-malate glycosyltransferase
MKIFFFMDSLHVGGSEGQMLEAAKSLIAQGDQVLLGCLRLEGPHVHALQEQGLHAMEFPVGGKLFSWQGFRGMLRLAGFLRRQRFEVVHTHDLYSNLVGIPAAWLARIPCIVSSRRDLGSWWWYTPRNRRLLRWIQRRSHRVLANSQGVKDHLVREDGFREDEIVVIRNAVDLGRFERAARRREDVIPGASSHQLLFAVVANMHVHTKGHRILIQAAKAICAGRPDVGFVLVGDGALRPEFEQLVHQHGLAGQFYFLGARKDIPDVLAACDAGLLASLAEGLPNVVLEYLAAGKPVVATSVGGVPEIIEPGVNGLLVPPGDPAALAAAVLELVSDRNQMRAFGSRGQAAVKARFSFERLVSELRGLYRDPRSFGLPRTQER